MIELEKFKFVIFLHSSPPSQFQQFAFNLTWNVSESTVEVLSVLASTVAHSNVVDEIDGALVLE